jgi:hypothetical protein
MLPTGSRHLMQQMAEQCRLDLPTHGRAGTVVGRGQ